MFKGLIVSLSFSGSFVDYLLTDEAHTWSEHKTMPDDSDLFY